MSAKTLLKPAAEMVKANHAHVLNESKAYRQARDALLADEIELRRHIVRVAEQRRALPPGGEGFDEQPCVGVKVAGLQGGFGGGWLEAAKLGVAGVQALPASAETGAIAIVRRKKPRREVGLRASSCMVAG